MQMSCEPLPDNPMRPPSEPRKPLKPLDQAWVDDRWRQTLGIFELLREHRYLMADAHQDTHAVAKRLLRVALKACIDNRQTVGAAIGSPASWCSHETQFVEDNSGCKSIIQIIDRLSYGCWGTALSD